MIEENLTYESSVCYLGTYVHRGSSWCLLFYSLDYRLSEDVLDLEVFLPNGRLVESVDAQASFFFGLAIARIRQVSAMLLLVSLERRQVYRVLWENHLTQLLKFFSQFSR